LSRTAQSRLQYGGIMNTSTVKCRLCHRETDDKVVLGIIERGGKSEESDVTFKPRAVVRIPICKECQKRTKRSIVIVTVCVMAFLLLFAAYSLFMAPSMCSDTRLRAAGIMAASIALAAIAVIAMFVFGEKLHYSLFVHKAYDRLKTIPAEDVLYSPKKHIVKISPTRSIIAIDKAEMLRRASAPQTSGKQQAMAMLGVWLDSTTESACPATENHEHTWNGCKCSSCSKQRTTGHRFRMTPGKCEAVCSVCGLEKVAHRFDNDGICIICKTKKNQ